MIDSFALSVPNNSTGIARLQDEIESLGRRHAFSEAKLLAVQFAVEEHLTNIVAYAYSDGLEHLIAVRVLLDVAELRVEVEDDGMAFNPLEFPEPDANQLSDGRPMSGLGILMMRRSMDGLNYSRLSDKNRLIMTKRI